jgi:pantothenate kinase-related protein Tda10
MERIIEAIALTLPSGSGKSHTSSLAGTLSNQTNQESIAEMKFDDYCIRELAFDLGVDPRALKQKLQSIFNN